MSLGQKFTTLAEIFVDTNGFRRLMYDGYRFGTRGKEAKPKTVWYCTANVTADTDNVRRRCQSKIRTSTINGYEMIQSTEIKHDH